MAGSVGRAGFVAALLATAFCCLSYASQCRSRARLISPFRWAGFCRDFGNTPTWLVCNQSMTRQLRKSSIATCGWVRPKSSSFSISRSKDKLEKSPIKSPSAVKSAKGEPKATSKYPESPDSPAIFPSSKAEEGGVLASGTATDDNAARREKGSEDGGEWVFGGRR